MSISYPPRLTLGARSRTASMVSQLMALAVGLNISGCKGDLSDDAATSDAAALPDTDTLGEASTLDASPNDTGTPGRSSSDGVTSPPDVSDRACPGGPDCPCNSNKDCDSALCIPFPLGGRCATVCVDGCDHGRTCVVWSGGGGDGVSVCAPLHGWLCDPCAASSACSQGAGLGSALCIPHGDGGAFCGVPCQTASDCPADFLCLTASSVEGAQGKQCLPAPTAAGQAFGECACSPAATTKMLSTPCRSVSQGKGETVSCKGTRACSAEGLTTCSAPAPQAEVCNKLDDDCDGDIDEGTCDDGNPCTTDTCAPGSLGANPSGCVFSVLDKVPCDADGSVCTEGDACVTGVCVAGKAKVCDDTNPCTTDVCDLAAGCTYTLQEGVSCDADGDACTEGDICNAGTCLPGPAKSCDDGADCTADSCDIETGKCVFANKANGVVCDDGSACTHSDRCKAGACLGMALNCNDGNPCTSDGCELATGCTTTAVDGVTCDDDNACTQGDGCEGGKCRSGTPKPCGDADPCIKWKCDPVVGKCKASYAQKGSACDDGSKCTAKDGCVQGDCLGQVVDCDDGNPCTDDGCDKTGGCTHLANTAPCDADSNACTVGDACMNKACIVGKAIACGDGNKCTVDSCDAKSGKCAHKPTTGDVACDDGNACTKADGCKDGACAGLPVDLAKDCDDTNPCTRDGCTGDKGCTHTPHSKPCDDGDACTKADTCSGGKCASTPLLPGADCDDGNACTAEGCDSKQGCTHEPNKAGCEDGNPCTQSDTCAAAKCMAGENVCGCKSDADCAPKEDGDLCNGTLRCDKTALPWKCVVDIKTVKTCITDGDGPCTKTACVPKTGTCVQAPIGEDQPCDADGSLCTTKDTCKSGKCVSGPALACDDGNPCTTDMCQAAVGCVNTPHTQPCNADDNACTEGDACQDGVCLRGKSKVCADDTPCTTDGCDAKTGGCVFDGGLPQGKACDADGSVCTPKDVCKGGKCVPGTPLACDDGNVCTNDSCDRTKGCVHALNTRPCDADGSACTKGDTCKDKLCLPGPILSCGDDNPCTDDGCDKTKGCVNTPNSKPCDADGSVCTAKDICKAGKCVPGAVLGCGDKNPCTDDGCDPKQGCTQTPNADPCDADGSVCTAKDVCKGGICTKGATLKCDDGNPCTDDACSPLKGCIHGANFDKCDADGNVCTVNDRCKDKVCLPGVAKDCDDANPCTDDECDPKQGCVQAANTKTCDADGSVCTQSDACKGGKCVPGAKLPCADGNPCTSDGCDAKSGCAFPAVKDGTGCDDKNGCTVADACKSGKCAGKGKSCDDGNPCTTDGCKDDVCTKTNNTLPCSDGDVCTVSDVCDGQGKCVGLSKKCADGNPCTDDGCESGTGCVFASNTAACDDGQVCTTKDTCTGGQCKGEVQKDCNDQDICTVDLCVSGKGCVHVASAEKCDDGDACTVGDTCKESKCAPGGVKSCDDGNVCTADGCDKAMGCTHGANTVACEDGSACTVKDDALAKRSENPKTADFDRVSA